MNPDDLRSLIKLVVRMHENSQLSEQLKWRLIDLLKFELRLLEKRG